MKTFIVTGGNRGLGLSIARHLAADTDAEVVLAVRSLERGQAAAQGIGPNVSARKLDLARRESIEEFIDQWEGPIEGLVNNAGV